MAPFVKRMYWGINILVEIVIHIVVGSIWILTQYLTPSTPKAPLAKGKMFDGYNNAHKFINLSSFTIKDLEPLTHHRRMMRQIRLPNLLAALLELHVVHRRTDVPPRIRLPALPGIRTHGIRPLQRKRPQILGIGPMDTRRGRGHHGDGHGQCLLRGHGPIGADLTGGDAEFALAEDVAGEDVCDAEDDDDDAGGDDDAPVGDAEGFLGGGFFVEVAEDGDADDGHEDAEGDEAVGGGEQGPGVEDVGAEEGGFGYDEEHWMF